MKAFPPLLEPVGPQTLPVFSYDLTSFRDLLRVLSQVYPVYYIYILYIYYSNPYIFFLFQGWWIVSGIVERVLF